MHKKKYGKMTVDAWLTSEMERSNPFVMVAMGILLTISGILVRAFVGSPYRTIMELEIGDLIPPVWVMTFLWSLSFFMIGSAAGFILAYRLGGCEGEKYKGCMFFVMLSVAELCWYPLFFGSNLLFFSALLSVFILVLSLAVTRCFYRVSKFAGMILLFHDIWLIYMLILNFAIFFRC